MRVDTNTKGHRQWFFFSIKNGSFKGKVKLNIFRFKKKYSLYQRGMKPYVFSQKGGYDWAPGGEKVSYRAEKPLQNQKKEVGVIIASSNQNNSNNNSSNLNSGANVMKNPINQCYYLSFVYNFLHEND